MEGLRKIFSTVTAWALAAPPSTKQGPTPPAAQPCADTVGNSSTARSSSCSSSNYDSASSSSSPLVGNNGRQPRSLVEAIMQDSTAGQQQPQWEPHAHIPQYPRQHQGVKPPTPTNFDQGSQPGKVQQPQTRVQASGRSSDMATGSTAASGNCCNLAGSRVLPGKTWDGPGCSSRTEPGVLQPAADTHVPETAGDTWPPVNGLQPVLFSLPAPRRHLREWLKALLLLFLLHGSGPSLNTP